VFRHTGIFILYFVFVYIFVFDRSVVVWGGWALNVAGCVNCVTELVFSL